MPDCRGTRPRSRGGRCWYPGGRSNPKHVSEAGAPTPLGFRHPSTPRHGNQCGTSIGAMLGRSTGDHEADTVPVLSTGKMQFNSIHGPSWLRHGAAACRRAAAIARAEREGRKGGRKRSDKAFFQLLPALIWAPGCAGRTLAGSAEGGGGEGTRDHRPRRNPAGSTGCPERGANPCSGHAPGVLLPRKLECG